MGRTSGTDTFTKPSSPEAAFHHQRVTCVVQSVGLTDQHRTSTAYSTHHSYTEQNSMWWNWL